MKRIICAVCLFFGLILSGCSHSTTINDNQSQHIVAGNENGYYLDVFSITSKDKERTGIVELSSFDEELFARIENVGQDRTLALQVYIDYQQVPIKVDGIEYDSYFIEADKNYAQTITFNISSDVETSQNHKMTVVLVAGADVITSQETFELTDQYTIALDYILSFSSQNTIMQSEYSYTELEPTTIQSSGIMLNTDFSEEERNRLPERQISVTAGESFNLRLSLGGYKDVSEVAVIISIGLMQAKINESDYIVCQTQDGAYSRGTIQLSAPDIPGLYEVMGFVVKNPFSSEISEWIPCDTSYRFTLEVLD